jgi:RNA polymerase sigma-70 factor, ECF subfamily
MSTVTISQENKTTLPEEFERLYREHATFVYRTALRITRNAEAEDVLQTIFLRLLRRESSPDLQKRPRAYLYRAAVNAALDTIESRRNRSEAADVNEIEATLHSPDSTAREKLYQQLHKAIAELNPTSAEMLILRYMHNCSDAAIAKLKTGSVLIWTWLSQRRAVFCSYGRLYSKETKRRLPRAGIRQEIRRSPFSRTARYTIRWDSARP